jgi:tRNA pseudouridine38-40 synthase
LAEQVGVRNIKLIIEYDGSDFCGWQKQPEVRTVEGELVRALGGLLGGEPEIVTAARTDSGVHAVGQTVNFSSVSAMKVGEIGNAVNSLLPPDIRVVGASEVPLAFNARFDAVTRVYRYEIATRPTSLWRMRRWYVKWDLDREAIGKAGISLLGKHDFSAYTYKDERRSPWIEMKRFAVEDIEPGGFAMVFAADRFLRRMVRILTGTLVEVGRGKLQPGDAFDILSNRERNGAGPCAPTQGLYLVGVEY